MQKFELKLLKNAYCDAFGLAMSEFFDVTELDEQEYLKLLSEEDVDAICEYAVIKNVLAGVGELNLKVMQKGYGKKYFDKYDIKGNEILSARLLDDLTAKDIVGGRVILELESMLDYNDGYLSRIVDFCATTDTPVLVKMGQKLEEVGKVVNKFNSSPAEVLEDFGFLDRECFIYGLNFLDKDDQKLLKMYSPTLILSPRDDAERGRGAINLYNFIFNELKFAFASGKCYNIDMFLEGKLALFNTANLMYESGLVDTKTILQALQSDKGKLELQLEEETKIDTIFDKKIELNDQKLILKMLSLKESIKQIARKIKEKI